MPVYELPFNGRGELTPLAKQFLEQRLNSFDCVESYEISDGTIKVKTTRELDDEEKELLPKLVDIWLKDQVELNFDIDFQEHLPKWLSPEDIPEEAKLKLVKMMVERIEKDLAIPKEMIEFRKSAQRGYHLRVKGLKFPPEEVLRMRQIVNDCFHRLREDRRKFCQGLDCTFLYDIKHGKKAGEWKPATLLFEEGEK